MNGRGEGGEVTRTDDMNTQNTVSLSFGEELDDAFHIIIRLRTGVGYKGEFADLYKGTLVIL